ncbi:hypothetical protein GQ44DRAFT_490264 [Phaeosphaeriaceae sp. PMI808]|nr:hypothetical protein GQ44DRAFT_490264 [Phaeosphaeriaceae sp. PMI808]
MAALRHRLARLWARARARVREREREGTIRLMATASASFPIHDNHDNHRRRHHLASHMVSLPPRMASRQNAARPCHFCRDSGHQCEYKEYPLKQRLAFDPSGSSPIPRRQDTLLDRIIGVSESQMEMDTRLKNTENRLPNTWNLEMTENHASPSALFAVPSNYTQESSSPQQLATSLINSAIYPSITDFQENSGLQSDYTTPAHKLLEGWPSMDKFWQGVQYLQGLAESGKKVSNYPMYLERDRVTLRVWGVVSSNASDIAP